MVLGVSERREVHLSPRSAARIRSQEGQEEDGRAKAAGIVISRPHRNRTKRSRTESSEFWRIVIRKSILISLFSVSQTKVTLETFLAWKKRKIQEKKDKMAKEEDQKKRDYKSGKQFGISGREMFSFNPELVDDGPIEDGDAAFDAYEREEDDDEVIEYKELDLEMLAGEAQEVSATSTNKIENRAVMNFVYSTGRRNRYCGD